jgi:bacillithiol system protein YtxJ
MGLFFSRTKDKSSGVDWVSLTSIQELDDLVANTKDQPLILFKHSTRCSISAMALSRLESDWDIPLEQGIPVFLNLIKYRDVSNYIADKFNVFHESPQILVIKNGVCTFNVSHGQISVRAIKSAL